MDKENYQAMFENNPSNVLAAYDILLKQIEAEINLASRTGSHAVSFRPIMSHGFRKLIHPPACIAGY
jgi:hypothetical protein